MFLMMKDEPVMAINFDEGKYEVINENMEKAKDLNIPIKSKESEKVEEVPELE